MQQQSLSTDSERDSLRALIDQKTKEWEAQNGKIETLDIVKKDPAAPDYYRKSADVAPAVEDIKAADQAIIERYPSADAEPSIVKPVKKTTQTTAPTERSAHYFRQQLTAINKEADAIEAKINAIAFIVKKSNTMQTTRKSQL